MKLKLDTMDRAKRHLAGLLIAGAALASSGALAGSTDLDDLAKNPQKFLGEEVELVGYCVKGGRTGDVLGYECTTDAGVYVDAHDIEPETAKTKLGDCGVTRNDECRATVLFVPHSYTTSEVIEADKSVVVFNTQKAKVSF